MKNILFIGILLSLVLNTATAQNRAIQFEKSKNWQEILDKAKAAKKLVFVDCYATWCGPCKQLSDNVFTQDKVVDYFNSTFINANFDVDNDAEGKLLPERYGFNSLPTLLFIDPATGEAVHFISGAGDAEWLLKHAKLAQDPKSNMVGMTKRYKAGERDMAFMLQYLDLLNELQQEKYRNTVIKDYLKTMPDQLFLTEEAWKLAYGVTNSLLDDATQRVIANYEKFYQILGENRVNDYINKIIRNEVFQLMNWKLISKTPFDEKRVENLIIYLKTIDVPRVPQTLIELDIIKNANQSNYAKILDCIDEAIRFNVFATGERASLFLESIELFANCKDKSLVEKALSQIDTEFNQTNNNLYKSNLLDSKVVLLESLGRQEEAKKANDEKYEYFEKGSLDCGGRILRMSKPRGNNSNNRIM